jgi:PAS domain S-box-containing protein
MFQYISDIHLEYLTTIPNIKKTANNLFLVGDIGHPGTFLFNKFLNNCSQIYKNVFLVYGNHEYYSILRGRHKKIETMQQKLDYAKDFPDNVYFLNNSYVYYHIYNQTVHLTLDSLDDKKDYIKIIGSTLWSNRGPGANNFNHVFIEQGTLLTFKNQCELFSQSKYYIIKELFREDMKSIILTHYSTHECANKGSYLDNKDTNHIRELFIHPKLIACINGHTHSSINTIAPGTNIKLLANCFGYKAEDQDIVKYNENAILELEKNTPVSFSGLYSSSEINPIDLLYRVMNRPNQVYKIGQVDESTAFTICMMTKDQPIVYVNRSFEKLTGYNLSEIRGKNSRYLQSPTGEIKRGSVRENCDNRLLFNIKTKLSKKEECQFITYNFRKNREKFINLITIIPIHINSVGYFVGFHCDVSTEFYKFKLDNLDKSLIDCNIINELTNDYSIIQEESIETASVSLSATMSDNYSMFSGGDDYSINESRKNIRYKHFFDGNPSFLCIIDNKGCFKKINSTFLTAMGYAKQEMYNKIVLDFIHPEDIASTLKSIDTIHEVKVVSTTNRYIRKDGFCLKINWTSYIKGKIIYCIGTTNDA